MKLLTGILFFSLFIDSSFAGQSYNVIVQPQQVRIVQPVVKSRLEYRTLDSYYLNYGYYYYQPQFVPDYNYKYVADPWQGYNY